MRMASSFRLLDVALVILTETQEKQEVISQLQESMVQCGKICLMQSTPEDFLLEKERQIIKQQSNDLRTHRL